MNLKTFFISLILLMIVMISGCKSSTISQQEDGTVKAPIEKEVAPTRDDFGCFPPSCSYIPDPSGQQMCEDWKEGRKVSWPSDCNYFSNQPACQKLCEFETSSAPVEQELATEQQSKTTPPIPCDTAPLVRQFSNTPYYTGPLFDDHYHMPTFFKVPDHPDAPIIDEDISRRDVACLFSDKERVKGVFAFYSIPINLKDSSLKIIQEIEQQYPGKISHFLEFVVFPGYSVDPAQIGDILNANKGLFKGYGEISLYLPHYSSVKPNDPAMRELYEIADKHNLIVMMHPIEGQQQAIEEVLRDYPNVQFLFHGAERLSSANMFHDTFLGKYPNAHYSVDIDLFGENYQGRPLLDTAKSKQDFITQLKQNWQSTLNAKVASWKSKIEKHPNQFLWGTDRGSALWQYDPEVGTILEEFSRTFIGQLNSSAQEKFAYKNAESLL